MLIEAVFVSGEVAKDPNQCGGQRWITNKKEWVNFKTREFNNCFRSGEVSEGMKFEDGKILLGINSIIFGV